MSRFDPPERSERQNFENLSIQYGSGRHLENQCRPSVSAVNVWPACRAQCCRLTARRVRLIVRWRIAWRRRGASSMRWTRSRYRQQVPARAATGHRRRCRHGRTTRRCRRPAHRARGSTARTLYASTSFHTNKLGNAQRQTFSPVAATSG